MKINNPNLGPSPDLLSIANYFIYISQKDEIDEGVKEGITHLKLQKILYFAQAAYLSLYDKELFIEDFQAWKYGPVIENLYHVYKDYNNGVLPVPDGYTPDLDEKKKVFLDGIWELFAKYSVGELINITHNHSPWKEAFDKGNNVVIEKKTLQVYYKDIFVLQED